MNHESLVEKYLGITNYHTEKIPLPPPIQLSFVDIIAGVVATVIVFVIVFVIVVLTVVFLVLIFIALSLLPLAI